MSALRPRFFDVPPNSTIEELQSYGEGFVHWQRDVYWMIGDLARYAEARWPESWHQVFSDTVSPGLVDRCKGVAKAYPKESDRNPLATWTQHMQVAGKRNRQELLAEMVSKGQTTDESRKAVSEDGKPRWLLAVDTNYHLHRQWYSGAGVEAAKQVSEWIGRTVERLKAKGLTDCVCCFDSANNFRKQLTAEWADQYKPRPPKEPELIQQLQLVKDLLYDAGIKCVAVDTFEADDVMASYAAQFDGRVTILTQDKDLKQCLSDRVNMLLDVDWTEDPTSGDLLPDYKWYAAGPGKKLMELRKKMATLLSQDPSLEETEALQNTINDATHPNLFDDTGLTPLQHSEFQIIAGDTVDGIKGAPRIGETGAKSLIKEFGTVESAIQAANAEDDRLLSMKRGKIMAEGLLKLESTLEITRQLVELRVDLALPSDTRI